MKRTAIALATVTLLITACSIRETVETTTTPPGAPVVTDLVLEASGIEGVAFGVVADDAVTALTSLIGGPDRDTGWIDGTSGIYGRCPGAVRAISWGSLTLFFGPGEGDGLFAYSYGFDYAAAAAGVDPRGLDLSTAHGVGLGTTVADLEQRAPAVVIDGDPVIDVWTFAIEPEKEPHLRGQVTGPEPEDTVLFIETSTGCE